MFINIMCQMVHVMIHLRCLTNEAMKILTANKSIILMTMSKQLLAYYLLKLLSNNERHHLACLFLKVVKNKFNIFAFPKLS